MADPSKWQTGQEPYPPPQTSLYSQQLKGYRENNGDSSNVNNGIHDQSSEPQALPPIQHQQQYLPLRPLQPNPYPTLGYPAYPYPHNKASAMQQEPDHDKTDSRRTRISRAW